MSNARLLLWLIIIRKTLSVVVVVLSVYILLAPFLPEIIYTTKNVGRASSDVQSPYISESPTIKSVQNPKPIPKDNRLVIPKIEVDSNIVEGDSEAVLDTGMWRRPKTSTPDKGGNTVITGHRFLYTSGQNTLYHLDKIERGDVIQVFWQEKEYLYEVFDIKTVAPTEIQIEDNTTEPILTIYTCTPLWTATSRLVVVAKPIKITSKTL
jgi:LPXTG-site transpeptidase (sortase) family protein